MANIDRKRDTNSTQKDMKKTFPPAPAMLLVLGLMLQDVAAATPSVSEAEDNAAETAPATSLASAELQPGPALVAGNNVNVRAQSTIHSEVITQLQEGDQVIVEEVILRSETTGKDPARWAQVAYPTNATAWVHSLYIDSDTSKVKARKLNVRSGPGENYTVAAKLASGDAITQIGSKGVWIEIAPPAGARAYIAAKLLRQELVEITETVAVVEEETEAGEIVEVEAEMDVEAEAGDPEMSETATESETTELAVVETETVEIEDAEIASTDLEPLPLTEDTFVEPEPEDPPPPRIVQREGIVRSFTSIQAPSHYKLVSADNGRNINYLYTSSVNLDLSRYVGLRIIVTGEESLDSRWPNMPVLAMQKIIVVE